MSDDLFIVQRGVAGRGEGNDTYILSGNLLEAGDTIRITDTEGDNVIQLIDGLSIVSSQVAADAIQLTLNNGAVVTILGADNMRYEVGGDPLNAVDGVDKGFSGFVEDVLGSTVPTGSAVNTGGAKVVDSTTTPPDSDDPDDDDDDNGSDDTPINVTLTDADSTGSGDEIQGTNANDTIQATGGLANSSATLDTEDTIVDSNLDDNDTLTITATTNIDEMASIISGIETINIDLTSFSDLTVNLAGVVGFGTSVTVTNLQTAGATGANVINVPGNATLVAGSGVTGTFSATLKGNATVDGRTAATTSVSGIDSGGALVLASNGSSVSLSGTSGTADEATIQGVGTVTLESAATDQVEHLTLEGNGGDVVFNLDATDDAPDSLIFSGDHSVTLALAVEQLTGLTVTDSASSSVVTGLKLTNAGTADLTGVSADVIEVAGTGAAGSYTVLNQQTVKLSADAAASGATLDANLASGSETLNLQVAASQTTGKITVSDFEVVNLSALNTAITINELEGDGTNTTVNVSGSQNLTLTKVTASGVNGSALTGNLTLTLADTLKSATGGSGTDTFIAWDGDMTLDGGSGTDTLQLAGGLDLSDNILFLTNIDALHITDDDAVSVTINTSELHNEAIAFKGTGTADTFILNMDGNTLDLSSGTVDSATASISVISTDVVANVLTITGSSGADTISAGSLADTIVAGEGADRISGNGGDDAISLTETTSAVDTLVFAGSGGGTDTITGFDAASDLVALSASDLTADSAAASADALKVASEATSLVTDGEAFTLSSSTADYSVIELTTTLDTDVTLSASSTGSDLLQALSSDDTEASGIAVNATGHKAFLVTYQNSDAFLWYISEGVSGAADTAVVADDIALVGVFDVITAGAMVPAGFVAA